MCQPACTRTAIGALPLWPCLADYVLGHTFALQYDTALPPPLHEHACGRRTDNCRTTADHARAPAAAARAPLGLLCGVGVLAERVNCGCCPCCWRCCCCCARIADDILVGLGAGELRLNSGARMGWRLGAASCKQLWLRILCVQHRWADARQFGRQ
jgi:hypothetical protein